MRCDPRQSRTGLLFPCVGFLLLLMLSPSILIYTSNDQLDTAAADTYDGVDELFSDFGDALCSRDEDKVQNGTCNLFSIVQFSDNIVNTTFRIFDEAVDTLDVIDDIQAVMNETEISLSEQTALFDTARSKLTAAEDDRAELVTAYEDLRDNEPMPGFDNLTLVDPDTNPNAPGFGSDVEKETGLVAVDGLKEIFGLAADLLDEANTGIEEALGPVNEIRRDIDQDPNNSDNDLRATIVDDVAGEIRRQFLELNEDLLDVQKDVQTFEDDFNQGLWYKSVFLQAFGLLPFLCLCLSSLFSYCRKRPWPLISNFVVIVQTYWLFAFLSVAFALISIVFNDVCDSHLPILETYLGDQEIDFANITVNAYSAVENTLFCGAPNGTLTDQSTFPWATPSNNLIGTIGVEELLDVDTEVEPVLSDIEEVIDDIDVAELLNDAFFNISENFPYTVEETILGVTVSVTVDEPTAYIFDSPDFNMTAYVAQCQALLVEAASKAFDAATVTRVTTLISRAEDYKVTSEALLEATDGVAAYEATVTQAINDVNATVSVFKGELLDLIDSIRDLVDEIQLAPNFILCFYIGDFYRSTVLGSMCTDMVEGFRQSYAPLTVMILAMAITWSVISYYFVRERFNKVRDRTPVAAVSAEPAAQPDDGGDDGYYDDEDDDDYGGSGSGSGRAQGTAMSNPISFSPKEKAQISPYDSDDDM